MKTNAMRQLDSKGINYIIKPHSRQVFTSEEAAVERGVKVSQIVKTMVVKTSKQEYVIALIPGDRHLNLKALGELVGDKKIKLTDRNEAQKITGYQVGAISPLGLHRKFHIVMDHAVLEEELVDISAGRPDAGIELQSTDLLNITEAEVAQISSKAST